MRDDCGNYERMVEAFARPAGGEPREELEAFRLRMIDHLWASRWSREDARRLLVEYERDVLRAAASPAGGPPGEREREDVLDAFQEWVEGGSDGE